MVPQTLIIEYLKIFKISDQVSKFIMKALENWKVILTVAGQIIGKGKIQKVYFSEAHSRHCKLL